MHVGTSRGGAENGVKILIGGLKLSRRLGEVQILLQLSCYFPVPMQSVLVFSTGLSAGWLDDFSMALAGNQATIQYQQTMTFIKPLYKLLKQKQVHPEMVAGLYMIVEAIKQRNYLHAYDVYMRLAIGDRQSLSPPGSLSTPMSQTSSAE